jgi:hypothetical protein
LLDAPTGKTELRAGSKSKLGGVIGVMSCLGIRLGDLLAAAFGTQSGMEGIRGSDRSARRGKLPSSL